MRRSTVVLSPRRSGLKPACSVTLGTASALAAANASSAAAQTPRVLASRRAAARPLPLLWALTRSRSVGDVAGGLNDQRERPAIEGSIETRLSVSAAEAAGAAG